MAYFSLTALFLAIVFNNCRVLSLECGSQSQKINECDLDIDVQCALDHGSMVYWANAIDKSKTNSYGTGPTTKYYSSADDAGYAAVIQLFQQMGPNRCNCYSQTMSIYQLDICYQFEDVDALKKKEPTFKVWAGTTNSNEFEGYFCCNANYNVTSQYAIKAIGLCKQTLLQPNVYTFEVDEEIKIMKEHLIMSSDCHFVVEVDISPQSGTYLKLRQYNVTSKKSYHSMWDFESDHVYSEKEQIFLEGHSDGNLVFKNGNQSKTLWQSDTSNKGKGPYKVSMSTNGHWSYKDSKGDSVWSEGKNHRAD